MSFVRGTEKFIHERHSAFETIDDFSQRIRFDVFVRKVDVRLDMSQGLHHLIAQLINPLRKFAGQLFVRGGKGELGPRMNLGDVAKKTVPKMCLVSVARHGGAVATRTFIPHRVHEAIGVLGAVSVATACVIPGTVAASVAKVSGGERQRLEVEHPTGFFTVDMEVVSNGNSVEVKRSALLRTARKLMSGEVFVPGHVWRRG